MENKTAKYFKYAIGEIVLVVIGILIALYINNQNEVRKNEAKFAAIFKDIQKDLSEDILDANNVFKRYIVLDSLENLFFSGKLEDRFGFIYRYVNFTIHNKGYSNLIRNSDNIPEKFTPLLDDLNEIYVERYKTVEVYNNRLQNTVYNSIDYLAKNKDWFNDWNYSKDNPEINQYFKTNSYYKNEVGLYMNDLKNLFGETNRCRVKSIYLYNEIENVLGNEKPIPKHVTNGFPDFEVLGQFEGTYTWQEGLDDYKDELMALKIIDGILSIGEPGAEESEFTELNWFAYKTFFISSEIFTFEISKDQVSLKINSFNGFEKWVKIN